MKGFRLLNGDIVIEKDIGLVIGNELTAQKIQQVLGTNLREWQLDEKEGIDFYTILTKEPNYERITDEVRRGILQVDETLELDDITFHKTGRSLNINFVVSNNQGERVEVNYNVDG